MWQKLSRTEFKKKTKITGFLWWYWYCGMIVLAKKFRSDYSCACCVCRNTLKLHRHLHLHSFTLSLFVIPRAQKVVLVVYCWIFLSVKRFITVTTSKFDEWTWFHSIMASTNRLSNWWREVTPQLIPFQRKREIAVLWVLHYNILL